jgi:hypothetical protein
MIQSFQISYDPFTASSNNTQSSPYKCCRTYLCVRSHQFSGHVGFVVNKVALRRFSPITSGSHPNFTSTKCYIYINGPISYALQTRYQQRR